MLWRECVSYSRELIVVLLSVFDCLLAAGATTVVKWVSRAVSREKKW